MRKLQKNKELFLRSSFFFLVSCVGCWSIIFVDGWPYNHELLSSFQRVEVFRIALESGDFFPLITPFAANGYGSMFPFFYHRLYNTVFSSIALVLGSTYLAVKISIPLLLTIGALGMYETAKELQLKKRYCFVASLLLIFSNYTLTDWLVRGAMAEFTASMLVPWLFLHCLKIIQGKKASAWLGIVMSLMFFAHSVIFYYSIFIYLLTFFLSFIFNSHKGEQRNKFAFQTVFSQLLVSGIIIITFVGFYALGVILISPDTSLSSIKDGVYNPSNQFQPIIRYLVDNDFHWGKTWEGFSVEIGRAISIPLILMILLLIITLITSLIKKEIFLDWLKKNAVFLITGLFFTYLQLPIAIWFYNSIPGADYIQFPWRLLVFLTPISIVLLCSILDLLEQSKIGVRQSQVNLFLLLAIFAHQILFTISSQNIKYERFTSNMISDKLAKESLADSLVFGGEYLPKGMTIKDIPSKRPFIEVSDCNIVATNSLISLKERIHFDKVTLTINSNPSCKIYFNQFSNPFIEVDPGKDGHVSTSKDKTIIVEPAVGVQEIKFVRSGLLKGILTKLNYRSGVSHSR